MYANCLILLLVTILMLMASGRIRSESYLRSIVPQQLHLDRKRDELHWPHLWLICWIQTSTGEAVADKMKIRIFSTQCRQIQSKSEATGVRTNTPSNFLRHARLATAKSTELWEPCISPHQQEVSSEIKKKLTFFSFQRTTTTTKNHNNLW